MTKFKTLEEVQKEYPKLDIDKFTPYQQEFLLNNEIENIDENYNINCEDCRHCRGCTGCRDCEYAIKCHNCRNCRYTIICRDCRYCEYSIDCEHCRYLYREINQIKKANKDYRPLIEANNCN